MLNKPVFNSQGNIIQGIYEMEWEDFEKCFGYTFKRQALLSGLKRGLNILKKHGCTTVYIDGSFVTEKRVPGDFDACWDTKDVDLDILKKEEPLFFNFAHKRKGQKIKFKGEFFPANYTADGKGTKFLDFFQKDKYTGEPKGIVSINLRRLK
ncbi:DUF6932 family protein [Priestia megaterium]|uniref:DUF6932 family protein n=1 Tax=Priestia megaterium TaxID=1404 RepID=UPI00363B973E